MIFDILYIQEASSERFGDSSTVSGNVWPEEFPGTRFMLCSRDQSAARIMRPPSDKPSDFLRPITSSKKSGGLEDSEQARETVHRKLRR